MRSTSKVIGGLSFHGTTLHTRVSWLIDLLGEPACGSDYGKVPMVWRAETNKGGVFCIFKEQGSQRYRRRHWLVFQILARDPETAQQALKELEETLTQRRQVLGEAGNHNKSPSHPVRSSLQKRSHQ